MSLAKDVQINGVGLTPNPVNASAIYLAQVDAEQIDHIWQDWASRTWGSTSSLLYG